MWIDEADVSVSEAKNKKTHDETQHRISTGQDCYTSRDESNVTRSCVGMQIDILTITTRRQLSVSFYSHSK